MNPAGRSAVGHVALFCPTMGAGGAEKTFRRLAVAFAGADLKVDLVLADAGGPNANGLPSTIRVVDLRCRRVSASIGPLVRYLGEAGPDTLVSTLSYANIAAVVAWTLSGKKAQLVLREANTLSVDSSRSTDTRARLIPPLARVFYPRADAIVAVSRGVANDLVEKIGIPEAVVRVIYNPAFDSELLALMEEPVTHPWFGDAGPPVLLSVGRLTPQKRFDCLIQALSIVRRQEPVRLVIFGEGQERNRLESLTRALALEDCVDLPGFETNPYAHMARARLYVMCSDWEGFPNALVEAMACGLRVVATDCPSGPREILGTDSLGTADFGSLVPVGDPNTLAVAILRELRLGRTPHKSRCRAERFTSERAARSYMDLMRTRSRR